MKKRIVAMLLVVVMSAGVLAGCGSGEEKNGSDATVENGEKESGTTESENAESVELGMLAVTHELTEDVEEMKWLAELAEETNVNVTYEQFRSDWGEVKQARFASGDIPDILLSAVSTSDFSTYDGLFLDLTDYITPELTPNIYAMFEEEPSTKILATHTDGKIYSLPKYRSDHPSSVRAMFINKVWLDNLGLDVPTTYSELKEVLIAFRDQDANGNGDPTDEIPMSPLGIVSDNGLSFLLGSLGIQMGEQQKMYCADDGVVQCYRVDERFKLFMEFCADLWKEGLLNPNMLTEDYSSWQATTRGNEAGEALVGVSFKWDPTDGFGTLADQYVSFAPLEYDINCEPGTYDVRYGNDFYMCNVISNRFAVSAACENPEAALRYIDAFYSPKHSVEAAYGGVSDGCVEMIDENTYKVLAPSDSSVDSGTWKWTNSFVNNAGGYISKDMVVEEPEDEMLAIKAREPYLEVQAQVTERDIYVELFQRFSQDEDATIALIETELSDIIDSYSSKWLIGELDIEETWDEYVQKVYDAGLEEVLEIRQRAFEDYLESIGQ